MMHKNYRSLICSLLLMVMLLLGGIRPVIGTDLAKSHSLTILFTHDLHSNLQPFSEENTTNNQVNEWGGLARIAEAIGHERQEKPEATILVDAGDFSMGTLFHVLYPSEAAELRLLGKMGYDAATFGNHEFEFDSTAAAQMLNTARIKGGGQLPVLVASNLAVRPESQSGMKTALTQYGVKDYTVLNKDGVRIGIFGLMGQSAVHDIISARDLKFKDPQAEAKRVVNILKNKEKADIIVCLSHSGTNSDPAKSEDELLAKAVPDIDVIISGHTHTLLTRPLVVGKTTIVSAGCYGRYLGEVKLDYKSGQRPQLVDYQLIPITPRWGEDQEIQNEIMTYQQLVDTRFLAPYQYHFNQIVAESTYNMGSIDTMRAEARETGLGDLVTDAFRSAVKNVEGSNYKFVSIAVQPMGEIRSSFTAGAIEIKDVFRTLSLGLGTDKVPGYPIVAFYLTGSDIKNCLEIQSTLAPMDGDYNMQVSGLKFKYNPHRLPLDRVYGVQVNMPDGSYQPLEKDKLYRIATSYYAASLLSKMGPMTHGIVNAAPKDENGRKLSNLNQALVDADSSQSGVQELKEWIALTHYLQSFKDVNGDGIADLPDNYQSPAGRYQAVASWNPYYLLIDATRITWAALAAGLILIGLLVLMIKLVSRKWQRRAGRGGVSR